MPDKRLVFGIFACKDTRQMSDLQFNTPQVRRFLIACRVLKRLLHPSIVSRQELVQRLFGEADAFIRLLKIVWSDAVVVNQRKHIAVDDNLSEFLHQIGGECGMPVQRGRIRHL